VRASRSDAGGFPAELGLAHLAGCLCGVNAEASPRFAFATWRDEPSLRFHAQEILFRARPRCRHRPLAPARFVRGGNGTLVVADAAARRDCSSSPAALSADTATVPVRAATPMVEIDTSTRRLAVRRGDSRRSHGRTVRRACEAFAQGRGAGEACAQQPSERSQRTGEAQPSNQLESDAWGRVRTSGKLAGRARSCREPEGRGSLPPGSTGSTSATARIPHSHRSAAITGRTATVLHAIELRDGRASYRNRWVRTKLPFEPEAKRGRALWTG
jgi:hypothetical protein